MGYSLTGSNPVRSAMLNHETHFGPSLAKNFGFSLAIDYKCVSWFNSYDAPEMLEFWGMQDANSFQSLPGLIWLEVVAPDRALWVK